MSEFKFRDRGQVADMVDAKGLEYFVTCYCCSDAMPDEELKEAFEKADKAVTAFRDLIKPN